MGISIIHTMNKTPLQKQNHVTWECTYHIVIAPKYRKKILFGQVRKRIGEILRELATQKDIEILEGHAAPDHIHMIVRIPPKYSVAHAMGFLKGKSAIRIHLEFSKKSLTTTRKNFWGRGYFVRTVGIDKEEAERYVKEQWKHHQYIDGPQLDLKWGS
jgi:putative transposase